MASERRKNVLLLWTDQQRPDTLGCYRADGSGTGGVALAGPRTPAVDRLAAEGFVFEQAYCTQPVCSPSRGSVLTGLYPHTHGVTRNGIPLADGVPTLAELLRPAGYACGNVGKWHLGRDHKPQHGFEDWWATTAGKARSDSREEAPGVRVSSYRDFLEARGYLPAGARAGREFEQRLPEAVGRPSFQAGEAKRFLETHRDRPFFLSVSFIEPHPPYFGPFDDLYDPDQVPLPRSWYVEMEPTVPLRYRRRREAVSRDHFKGRLDSDDEAGWKALKARYWGNCTLVDKYAGQILQTLADLGLAEDTVVVYTADHGEMMGEHRLLAKQVAYEGAVRVPLIIRAPGLGTGRVATPVSQVQLVPTLLALLGQPVPAQLQGAPLPDVWGGREHVRSREGDVVIEWNGFPGYPEADDPPDVLAEPDEVKRRLLAPDVRTIRRGRWKLNVHLSGEHELYDLEGDPEELHNAFRDAGSGGVVGELYGRLREWQGETGDALALPEPWAS